MLFAITIVFVVSFLPHLALMVLTAVDEHFWASLSESEAVLCDLLLRSYFINNMANPIIYGFLDIKFRIECTMLFKTIFRCSEK
jgi:hypothetical protein